MAKIDTGKTSALCNGIRDSYSQVVSGVMAAQGDFFDVINQYWASTEATTCCSLIANSLNEFLGDVASNYQGMMAAVAEAVKTAENANNMQYGIDTSFNPNSSQVESHTASEWAGVSGMDEEGIAVLQGTFTNIKAKVDSGVSTLSDVTKSCANCIEGGGVEESCSQALGKITTKANEVFGVITQSAEQSVKNNEEIAKQSSGKIKKAFDSVQVR